ncbi:protein JINGUBANG-like [Benincasa hispida]|uniref:protein JINGUBANG-like n=1 Tax=Benincasa hispida TaxID=102211 RepID=UPI0018FF98EE|nr:protein JINGUBANG-like [Benincasa hispida]
MLFTSHRDLRIRVWNFTVSEKLSWKKVCCIPKKSSLLSLSKTKREASSHKDTISCIAYYLSQDLLYTASHDKTVKVWRISDRKCVDSFLAHEHKVNSLTVNQNDGCLFTCSSDATVKIWRRLFPENSHTLTMTLKFQASPVNAVVLSIHHDATFLYSGSSDGTINFWEKEKVSYRYNHGGFLQGHRFGVLCLAVVEMLVMSGSEDTTVRIWRREEGGWSHECLAVLDGHRGPVRCLAGTLETVQNRVMNKMETMENRVMENRLMNKMETNVLVYSGSLDQTFKVWRVKVYLGHNDQYQKELLEYEEEEEDENLKMKKLYEMSPVLSPSWVQKKLQPKYF